MNTHTKYERSASNIFSKVDQANVDIFVLSQRKAHDKAYLLQQMYMSWVK